MGRSRIARSGTARWAAWAAPVSALATALLVGCGGGGGGDGAGTAGGREPPVAPADAPPGQAVAAASTLALNAPSRTRGQDGLIELRWTASEDLTRFSAWVSKGAGRPFEAVALNVQGQGGTFHPGPTWQIDFPEAQVRVQGCAGETGPCVDSNTQPLAEALVASRPSLIPSGDPATSGVGGSSEFVMNSAGTAIAALRRTATAGWGTPVEYGTPARVELHRTDFLGNWVRAREFATPDPSALTIGFAFSGDGNTLAVPLAYSYGAQGSSDGVQGVIVVYRFDPGDGFGGAWRVSGVVSVPASLAVVPYMGPPLALSHDGSRLAAGTGRSVMVFDRQPDDSWRLTGRIAGVHGRSLAMSADGRTIAFGVHAGEVNDRDYYEVHVHACEGEDWPLVATLRSAEHPYAGGVSTLDDFGDAAMALSADGRTLAVGAPGTRYDATRPGAAYVFERGAGGWQRAALLTIDGETDSDVFGRHLALSGDGRLLAASACGRFEVPAGVNRNYAGATPPRSDRSCREGTQQPSGSKSLGLHVFRHPAGGNWTRVAAVVPDLPPPVNQAGGYVEVWMVPTLNHDGSVLGVGAFRNAEDTDGIPGEANLYVY
jgi:hypothetical protein